MRVWSPVLFFSSTNCRTSIRSYCTPTKAVLFFSFCTATPFNNPEFDFPNATFVDETCTCSHYTERKKCGPRSGQKTSKGTRRARLSPSPSSSPGLKSTAPHSNEQQAQHQYDSISRVPGADMGGRSMAKDSLEWQYVGIPLGSAPPMHTHPALSADETSGDTTSIDYTDVSDAPSLRHLSRDGSGSSWWSLEEQQASMSVGMGLRMGVPQPNHVTGQGHGHGHQHGSTRPVQHMSAPTATGMHPSPMQTHAAMQAATWNATQRGRKFSSSVAVADISDTNTPPQYPHQNLHQEVRASHSAGACVGVGVLFPSL